MERKRHKIGHVLEFFDFNQSLKEFRCDVRIYLSLPLSLSVHIIIIRVQKTAEE